MRKAKTKTERQPRRMAVGMKGFIGGIVIWVGRREEGVSVQYLFF